MPAQLLDSRAMEEFLPAIEPGRLIPLAAPAAPSNMIALPTKIAEADDPAFRDGNCLNALIFAVGFEAAIGMLLYGVWQLWQIAL